MKPETDLYALHKAPPPFQYRLRKFIKDSGIELTIAIVGIFIGIATVMVTAKVGKHQEILQASRMTDVYFNGITDLFARSMEENQRIDLIIIARTEAIIEDLDSLNKPDKLASIITFLSNLRPGLFSIETVNGVRRDKFIDLSNVNLSGTYLKNIHLPKATLYKANLSESNLFHSHLQGANLRKAKLIRANLNYANLNNANLTDANLSNASIDHATFDNADLQNAIWTNGMRCKEGSIGKCKLT